MLASWLTFMSQVSGILGSTGFIAVRAHLPLINPPPKTVHIFPQVFTGLLQAPYLSFSAFACLISSHPVCIELNVSASLPRPEHNE